MRYPSDEVDRFDQQFAETEDERNERLRKRRMSAQRSIGECERNGGHVFVTGPGDLGGTGDGRHCAKGCGAVEQF